MGTLKSTDMEHDENNAFANWLFNEYVKAHRKADKCSSRHYWHVLATYAKIGFPKESQEQERKYAEKLNKIIENAFPDWNTHLLILRGEEGRAEYTENMASYEKRLRAIGHNEESIINLITKKIILNYGID
ncbi:hypothetical protein [Chryseobacterium sp. ISL-6]|uniref:hypothetical protein n=1 Tax=Chryseobacterium sp. ISL-6 TaxID=2819143 RepID=UPI001BE7A863|nr:hypothetical protein [Chryseobacterium sp. ISL-6]MBT2621943.1 hypothetical protein [Chryseobacterium sp. ISL-6]